MMISRTYPHLPVETIESIIAEVWSQTTTASERWDLYENLRRVHPLVHELLVTVAARHPCFIFNASLMDMELYGIITKQAASFVSTREGRWADAPTPQHTLIDITLLAHYSRKDENIWRKRWGEYVNALQRAVYTCSSITLLSTGRLSTLAMGLALRSLPSFFRLTHLYLKVNIDMRFQRLSAIHSVRFLRIDHYRVRSCPACPDCTCATLLHAFPNVRHLHLDHPAFLPNLRPPHSLHTMTLEASKLQPAPQLPPFRSLLEYDIPDALREGFLQWPRQDQESSPSTIVVYTGPTEPLGFEQAQLACERYGVTLQREIVYAK